jgi:hypothetical protein
MPYQVRNIIVGAASLFVSTSDSTSVTWNGGPTLPSAVALTSFAATLEGNANFRNAGFTSAGLELSYQPDYADVEVDQLFDAARLFKQALKVMLST